MSTTNMSLFNSSHTGSAYPAEGFEQKCVIPMMGTGATQLNDYPIPGESERTITAPQLHREKIVQENILLNRGMQIQSIDEQLRRVKQLMGLNILELAAILHVSRPTIYAWIESQAIKIRKKNRERLYNLNEISKVWQEKNLGHLGSYLYKALGNSGESLFALLKGDPLAGDKEAVFWWMSLR